MGESTRVGAPSSIGFESYGVQVRVTTDSQDVLERLPQLLPLGAAPCDVTSAAESFGVLHDTNSTYQFMRGDSPVTRGIDLQFATMLLENQLRIYVGHNAPGLIFVHAGVVAHDGRAIVLPGRSLVGKSRLVLALMRAGAVYYSDEFAVIDGDGLVHPYAKPLSIRDQWQVQNDHDIVGLGGQVGEQPLKIGLVVMTAYRPGSGWSPTRLSVGQGVLEMLGNTIAAVARAQEAISVLRRAIDDAVLLAGDRGEAEEIAPALLAEAGAKQ